MLCVPRRLETVANTRRGKAELMSPRKGQNGEKSSMAAL